IVLSNGSFIQPVVSGFIPLGQVYNVIFDISERIISDGSTIVQPTSPVISFTKQLVGPAAGQQNIVQLVSQRNTYSSLSDPVTAGIAGALDNMAKLFPVVQPLFLPLNRGGNAVAPYPLPTNMTQTLVGLLGALDQLPTQTELIAAMDSLQFF